MFSILLLGCLPCKDTGRPLVSASTRFDYVTIESGFYSHTSRIVLSKEDSLKLMELFADCKECQDDSEPDVMVKPAISYTITFRSNRSSEMFAKSVAFGPSRELYQGRCRQIRTEARILRILTPYMDRVDQIEASDNRDKKPVY
ncbi:MAG: hypothetical protein CFE26_19515 [Verrucomicrobiales bacterium VVV1]|nr:MAG: hypothetical protein CFE26_19515 [Verrucomicrobiales bacterium VVV1]